MTMNRSKTIHVIGDGAASIAMVVKLLKDGHREIRWHGGLNVHNEMRGLTVTEHPYGMAYQTTNPRHLLNAEAHTMSIPDEETFPEFLQEYVDHPTENLFVYRGRYRMYLRSVLQRHWDDIEAFVDMLPVMEKFDDERVFPEDAFILCCGATHKRKSIQDDNTVQNPWDFNYERVTNAKQIRILGSGLTALDTAISIWTVNPQCHITFVSRNGRFPIVHGGPYSSRPGSENKNFDLLSEVIKDSNKVLDMLQVVRGIARMHGWHPVMKAMRHRWKDVWRRLDDKERTRFIRRIQPIWEIYRHRMVPETYEFISAHPYRIERLKDSGLPEVDWEFNATGVNTNPAKNSLIRDMAQRRMVSYAGPDFKPIGLSATPECKVGHNIWCVGAYMRWERWEATAMADIIDMVNIVARQLKTT